MDIQQISDSAKAIASDAQAIDLRFQASRDLKRRIAPIMASKAPFILLKTLLMIVFTSFPDPDEIAGHVDSGEIVSIDFMVRILTNIEECVEMNTLRLATDSPDGKCLHNFFNPLRLLDCRFLRSPLPAIEKHWSASSLAVEKLYRQLHTAAIANTTSIDISPLLTADYLQPPSFGMIRNWLRDVMVTKVAIAEDIEDASFSPLKMVLILPTAIIQAIVSGETVDLCIPAGQFRIDIGRCIAQDWPLDSAELFPKLERAIVDDDCTIGAVADILHCEGPIDIPWRIASLAQSKLRLCHDIAVLHCAIWNTVIGTKEQKHCL